MLGGTVLLLPPGGLLLREESEADAAATGQPEYDFTSPRLSAALGVVRRSIFSLIFFLFCLLKISGSCVRILFSLFSWVCFALEDEGGDDRLFLILFAVL
ncbi:hypothetical protein KFK09_005846 [Dendrobium nobile]|uniref:Uncharacterized protein n=1 Tax=Dendrobium nobile TaxID=94219 RepID=A0A8T3BZE2_DENNO|nr:hypothetical protein KFK09_005846 [Dendrobium nobile]